MNDEQAQVYWRDQLAQLPQESPPPATWLALQSAFAGQVRPRRRYRQGLWAVAALLMLTLAPLWWLRHVPAPPDLAQVIEVDPDRPTRLLRALDRELQLRYQEGASDEELAPLWRERERLLQHPPSAPAKPSPEIIRI